MNIKLTSKQAELSVKIIASANLLLLFIALKSVIGAQGFGVYVLYPLIWLCLIGVAFLVVKLINHAILNGENSYATASAAVLVFTNLLSSYFVLTSKTYISNGIKSSYVVSYEPTYQNLMALLFAILFLLLYIFITVYVIIED